MFGVAREYRTELFGVIADRNDVIEFPSYKLINGFRAVTGNVDPDLDHDGDCFGPNSGGPSASGIDLETITGLVAKKPFRHLAPCGIAGAKDQNCLSLSCVHLDVSLYVDGKPSLPMAVRQMAFRENQLPSA